MKKVVVFAPVVDVERVREAIGSVGAGKIGNYMESLLHTLTGSVGRLRAMDEEKIEFACDDETYRRILAAIGVAAPLSAVDSWNLETYAI